MADGATDRLQATAVGAVEPSGRRRPRFIGVPGVIALITTVAAVFQIFGITASDLKPAAISWTNWSLRVEPSSANQDAKARAQEPAIALAAVAEPGRNTEPAIKLGMQPTTYAALPPAPSAALPATPPTAPPAEAMLPQPFPTAASGTYATYLFNGREMSLQTVGERVQVRYLDVRKELAENGVKVGDLFVEFRLGGDLNGTAQLRSGRCGAAPYDVSGTSQDDYRVIRLKGDARKFGEGCRLTSEAFPMSIVMTRK